MPDHAAFHAAGAGPVCALCGSRDLRVLRHLPASQIQDLWLKKYDIAVGHYFPVPEVTNYACEKCSLEFSLPPSPGDDRMYEQLSRFPWYYEQNKWEFRASLARLGKPGPALEVGCGSGNFLRELRRSGFHEIVGVDSNKRALEALRSSSIPAFERLEQLGARRFDYIFAFQVLEHVPDPRAFLDALMPFLNDHGRLFVAVPNQDSFIGDDTNQELNQPPHHCSRFRAKTFREMSRFLPLECEHIACEPLSDHHVGWYLATRMQPLSPTSLAAKLAWRTLVPLAERALKIEPLRQRIKGHTLLAVLRHVPSKAHAKATERSQVAL